MSERVATIGLGYVGLPVAMAFARHYQGTVGFDIDPRRVAELESGRDRTGEVTAGELRDSTLVFTSTPETLAEATVYVVAVPTPIDSDRRPDLGPVKSASRTIAPLLRAGDLVVYESTVYPGVTEDVCGPLLCEGSGLAPGEFQLGYSPERINPGDKEHRLETIVKVVSGDSVAARDRVAALYAAIVEAGVHVAPSIKAAEAAKVIENTQRDLNIALMNELAIIFDRLGIRTVDVLAAAGTKWNFLPFRPGLVGGHCIGVDPYYLTAKAESVGYHPEVILAGRRVNDGMGGFVARKLVKMLIERNRPVRGARVGVLGLTFKENVPDLRNSRVPDILEELRDFGIDALVHDPMADPEEAEQEFGVTLSELAQMKGLDGLVLAVAHEAYLSEPASILGLVAQDGVVVDVKSAIDPASVGKRQYWSL
jgi:UDP-N-acetyl-D-galactosamine dehydrogenase